MILHIINSNSWQRAVKPVASFFSVQIVVQALSLLAGLLLVRTMSKSEYALFTVAGTMQGTMNLLADLGVTSAISATGGLVWQDRYRLGQLIQTGLEFRRKFGIVSFILIGPLLWWMLVSNGAGFGYALLVSIIVVAGTSAQLTHGIFVMVPRLHARVQQLQWVDLAAALLRLVLIGAACLLTINAAIAVSIGAIALWLQNVLLRRKAAMDADLTAPSHDGDRKTIWQSVWRVGPNAIYYCIQGQLVVFLISLFGNTRNLANVGALGRLAAFFTITGSVMTNVVLPRFARCQDTTKLRKMYAGIVAGYMAFAIGFLAMAIFLPGPMLWLLGGKYAHLQEELAYIIFLSVVSAISGALYSLNMTRGWIAGNWITIPLTIGCQVALVPFLDLSSVKGIVLLSALPDIPCALIYFLRARKHLC